MFDRFMDRLDITGHLVAQSALRIGTERSVVPVGTETYRVLRDASGNPFIPGASLKGILRAYLETWVRGKISPQITFSPHVRHIVCNPTGDDAGWCISNAEMRDPQTSPES